MIKLEHLVDSEQPGSLNLIFLIAQLPNCKHYLYLFSFLQFLKSFNWQTSDLLKLDLLNS